MHIWEIEPDRANLWYRDLPMVVNRVERSGHLCGYVGIPESNKLFGKEYSDILPLPETILNRKVTVGEDINLISLFCLGFGDIPKDHLPIGCAIFIHGGLTWAEDHPGCEEPYPSGFWWFGFDCAHCDDLQPKDPHFYFELQTYRDFNYVVEQCRRLANQLLLWQD